MHLAWRLVQPPPNATTIRPSAPALSTVTNSHNVARLGSLLIQFSRCAQGRHTKGITPGRDGVNILLPAREISIPGASSRVVYAPVQRSAQYAQPEAVVYGALFNPTHCLST